MNDLVDLSQYAGPGQAKISDFRLAAAFKHKRSKCQTVLLTAEKDGKVFDLMLSGYIEGVDHLNNSSIDSSTITEEQLLALERKDSEAFFDMEHGPWFEWVTADGESLGDISSEIDVNPLVEVEKLHVLLDRKKMN